MFCDFVFTFCVFDSTVVIGCLVGLVWLGSLVLLFVVWGFLFCVFFGLGFVCVLTGLVLVDCGCGALK